MSFLGEGSQWKAKDITAPEHDPERAKTLLDEAGTSAGQDGIRVVGATGARMSYTLHFPASAVDARAFQLLVRDMEEVGIELKLRGLDEDALFDTLVSPDGKYLKNDLGAWSWTTNPDPDGSLRYFLCEERGCANDSGYCNKRYDDLSEQQRTEVDVEKRGAIVDEMQRIILRDRPYILIEDTPSRFALSSKFGGDIGSFEGPFLGGDVRSFENIGPAT